MTKGWKTALYAALASIAFVGVAILPAGCGKISEPFNDAPRSKVENNAPADVVTFPDGFSNVATKCDHGNRVYVAFHGDNPYAAIAVVANDPTCGK